jgi:hypothetical protein
LTAIPGASGSFTPGLTGADLLSLKAFLTPSSSYTPYVVGQVTSLPSGLTGSVINQFSQGDLVKLKVANVNEVGGNLQIAFSHPLDITQYRDLGIVITPLADNFAGSSYAPYGITGGIYGATASYQFGASDSLGETISYSGGTGGTANALVGQISTPFYQNVLFDELQNGDIIYTNNTLTTEQYLTYLPDVDRDQFNLYYAFAYSNISRNPISLVDITDFGLSYASNTTGQYAGYPLPYKLDIVSSYGSINEFIEVAGGINGKVSVTSFKMNSNVYTISVGDLLVSTDQDLCQIENTNRQVLTAATKKA